MKLLIIDDDPYVLRSLARALEREGYEVVATESPGEALTMELSDVAAVLCDWSMPVFGGDEVLEGLRAWRNCGVPFFFITAHGNAPELRAVAARYGAEVVDKPFEMPLLRHLLERRLHA